MAPGTGQVPGAVPGACRSLRSLTFLNAGVGAYAFTFG